MNCIMDGHWKPYFQKCDYCDVDFDVIGKMETFNEDVDFIFQSTRLDEISSIRRNEKLNSHQRSNLGQYFQNLSENVIRQLYEVYKIDFEMFDYGLEI